MKSKTYLYTAVLLGLITVFTGCKKYEDGPLISLRSKNARITGTWELKEYHHKRETEEGTATRAFNGSTVSFSGIEYNGVDYVDTAYTYAYEMSLTIKSDGVYTWSQVEDGDEDEWTAYWSWFDGQSGKEQLYLEDDGVFLIKKLTNNELVVEYNYSWTKAYEDEDKVYAITTNSWTFEKMLK